MCRSLEVSDPTIKIFDLRTHLRDKPSGQFATMTFPLTRVTGLTDARLEPYRHLKQTNLTRWSGQFIAEGKLVVERLLASRFAVESLLLSERRLALLEELPLRENVPVLVISEELARELTGFQFHAGVLACGLRGAEVKLTELLTAAEAGTGPPPLLLLCCPHITDPDNLGSLLRLARAFDVAGLLLGPDCCDPFSRRTLRVSMGNAFDVPIIESVDLAADLKWLRDVAGFRLAATVLAPDATSLVDVQPAARELLLLGNEAQGLAPQWVELADRRVTIPMSRGADSLNVSVAAGIFLHWFRYGAGETRRGVPTEGGVGWGQK